MIVSDEGGPFVPARIMVKTVKEDKDIVPILEPPPVVATVMLPDTSIDRTKSIVNPIPYCTGFQEIKRTRRERERERRTVEYHHKEGNISQQNIEQDGNTDT